MVDYGNNIVDVNETGSLAIKKFSQKSLIKSNKNY